MSIVLNVIYMHLFYKVHYKEVMSDLKDLEKSFKFCWVMRLS